MPGQIPGVVLGAVDEVRLAPAKERQPHYVQTRCVGDTAVVADVASGVEDGHLQPRVVWREPYRPHDGPGRLPLQIAGRAFFIKLPDALCVLGNSPFNTMDAELRDTVTVSSPLDRRARETRNVFA